MVSLNPQTRICTGNARLADNAVEDAIDLYTKGIAAAPAGAHAHILHSNRAAAHTRLGQYEDALADALYAVNRHWHVTHAMCTTHPGVARHMCRPTFSPDRDCMIRRAVSLSPRFAKGHARVGTSLFHLRR